MSPAPAASFAFRPDRDGGLPLSPAASLALAQRAVAAGDLAAARALVAPLRGCRLGASEATALGLVHLIAEDLAAAVACFDDALRADPSFRFALTHRAVALQRLGRLDESAAAFAAAVAAGVDEPEHLFAYGMVLRSLGRRDAAGVVFDRVLARQPDHADALLAGGEMLLEIQNGAAALSFFEAAVRADRTLVKAWFAIGVLQQGRGDLAAALAAFDMVLDLRPGNADALSNRGVILLHLGRNAEALAACDAALAVRPGFAEALSNRGCALMRLLRFDEALAAFEAALTAKPDHLEALCNRALALQELGRLDEAAAGFKAALRRHPEAATVAKNLAMLQLLRGDFELGFAGYEARWAAGQTPIFPVEVNLPEWPGPAAGYGRLLVVDEQGFGDAIMFARFLPWLAARGATVTFLCRPNLCALLAPSLPGVRVVADVPAERFDHQIALASLPRALGVTLETIPAAAPYLAPEAARAAAWAARIGEWGFRVGLCWQGSATNVAALARSIPLAAFAPLAQIPGVRLISLQQRDGLDQVAALSDTGWLERWPGADTGPDAFLDTAAIMAGLDLVISCDTAVAHLAGALGRPVWTLLKTNPDWRWQLDRPDSPWYPTMRLFRQRRPGGWDGVIAAVGAALRPRA